MKKYHKVGGKPGRPGYRTPSGFKYRKSLVNKTIKSGKRKGGAKGKNNVYLKKNSKIHPVE